MEKEILKMKLKAKLDACKMKRLPADIKENKIEKIKKDFETFQKEKSTPQ